MCFKNKPKPPKNIHPVLYYYYYCFYPIVNKGPPNKWGRSFAMFTSISLLLFIGIIITTNILFIIPSACTILLIQLESMMVN